MKKIIESQISLFSQTNKVSVPVQICYTDDEVEITINNIMAQNIAQQGKIICGWMPLRIFKENSQVTLNLHVV